MLADYVMKSIDNLFQQKLSLKTNNKNNTSKLYNNQNSYSYAIDDGNDIATKEKIKHLKTQNAFFNKDYIKENLHRVIKKNSQQEQSKSKCEKSPSVYGSQNSCIQLRHMRSTCDDVQNSGINQKKSKKSISPISKSRLKLILQHNKQQRIRSVVKSKKEHSQSKTKSPYTKIEETISQLSRVTTTATIPQLNLNDISINQYNSNSQTNKKHVNITGTITNIDKKDKIAYYRQQRKELSKSKSRSKIFTQNQQQFNQNRQISQQYSQTNKSRVTPSKKTQIYRSRSKIFKNLSKMTQLKNKNEPSQYQQGQVQIQLPQKGRSQHQNQNQYRYKKLRQHRQHR